MSNDDNFSGLKLRENEESAGEGKKGSGRDV